MIRRCFSATRRAPGATVWRLIAHPNFLGILPLLDSKISEDLTEQSWYVMPEATPILKALGSDPEPGLVVAAVAEIATTLTALAAKGTLRSTQPPAFSMNRGLGAS